MDPKFPSILDEFIEAFAAALQRISTGTEQPPAADDGSNEDKMV